MKHKGLLFDLDGVIVDTAKYHFLAWKQLADDMGINFTIENNERLKGVSRLQSFEIILELGGIYMTSQEKEKYCEKKNAVYKEYIMAMTKDEILPGVQRFLADAKDSGYKIALGSASKNSVLILERLQLLSVFDEIIDGTKVKRAKPDPEVFLKGAEVLGLKPQECIVFEDAVAGIRAAHAAGMRAIGIGNPQTLYEADYHMPGFENIRIGMIEDAL